MQQLSERPRALRYGLSAPLVYRSVGEATWRRGRTENISRSGVLFEAAAPVFPAATRIEFVLKLPGPEAHGGAWVQCEGQVVRSGGAASGESVMAATIDAYNLLGTPPDGIPGVAGL
jgi:hypothetical protein